MKQPDSAQLKLLEPLLLEAIQHALELSESVSPVRQDALAPLRQELGLRLEESNQEVRLLYVCTHNSRRSHLGQVWGQVAAWLYGFSSVKTYSAGTEVTEMNPRTVASLRRSGYRIEGAPGQNPHYRVQPLQEKVTTDVFPMECFSKLYDDVTIPQAELIAVMTCDHADKNCPVLPGARRISLPWSDPKVADDTDQEEAVYDQRSLQIASEMLWLFGHLQQ
ncbi:MAG: hypothetical protein MK135_04880 [Polyangiaceae bacterium]|nr:hypothetical protein [Polyangiaceae bacterium]